MKAHEAWLDVMDSVQSIAKTDRNQSQNFDFRGIDATVNRFGPALRSARVFVRPRRVLERSEERYETRGGASMRNVTLRIEWEVTGPEGDSFLAETVGEAADAGDKAVTKAHSVALRTFFLQAGAVPTGDRDPDADSHERAGRRSSGRDWAAEAAAATDAEAVRVLWRQCGAAGEGTEQLRQTFLQRAAMLAEAPPAEAPDPWNFDEALRVVGEVLKPAASPSDPWTTPAPEPETLPLPEDGAA